MKNRVSKRRLTRIDKPWGHEVIWAQTEHYLGKILHIRKGHMLSLQLHSVKDETFVLWEGRMRLVHEDEHGRLTETIVGPGEAHHVPAGRVHRFVADEDCVLFEVSTNHPHDVVRLGDQYGRVSEAALKSVLRT